MTDTLSPSLPSADVATLRTQVAGVVAAPGDDAYAERCLAWNRASSHTPAVIVEAADVADVVLAVRFAADHGLGVGVQATGHGLTMPVDGVLVLTRLLTDVSIDPTTATAWVAAGAQWGPVLEAAQAHGLAPLCGSSPTVGAIGYTLGGGVGWLARKHGTACDRVRSFEVVLHDGSLVRASADENPELFRALRGGGGGAFGVVTGMEIELVPVTTVYAGNLLYPAEAGAELAGRYADWIADAPDDLSSEIVFMNFPPIPDVPEPIRGKSFTIIRGCWAGDLDAGRAFLDAWRAENPPIVDMWAEMPFSAMAAISNDPVDPIPAVSASGWLTDLDAEVGATLAGATFPTDGPPTLMFSEVRHLGGAVSRGDRAGSSMGNRDLDLLYHSIGVPMGPGAEQAIAGVQAGIVEALGAHYSGRKYLNFAEGAERRLETDACIDAADRDRLAAVAEKVDPHDRFHYGVDHRA